MRHATIGAVALLALACGPTEGDGDGADGADQGPTPDPDVRTFVPEGFGATDPARVIFFGDSITAGAEASRPSLTYTALLGDNDDGRWPDHAEIDLGGLYGVAPEAIDVSRGGAVTGDLLPDQAPRLEAALSFPAAGETIVVMTIGGNDLQNALNPLADPDAITAEALDNIEEFVGWIQDPARFPDGVSLYLTNVYEPSDGVGQADECFLGFPYASRLPNLDGFNADLVTMGEDLGFSVVDLRGHFLGHGFHHDDTALDVHEPDDPSLWLAPDCIHPNDRGHHEVRRLFHAAIAGEDLPLEVNPAGG